MPIAINDQGQKVELINNQWIPIQQAVNDAGEKAELIGGQWTPVIAQQSQDTTFGQDAEAALSQRGEQFGKQMQPILNDMTSLNPLTSIPANLTAIRRTGGLLAGGLGDVIGAGVSNIADTLTPEPLQERVKSLMGDIGQSAPVQAVMQANESLKLANPSAAQDLADLANMAGIVPVGKAAQIGLKGTGVGIKGVGDVADLIPQSLKKQDIAQQLLEGSTDARTAPFQVSPQNQLQQFVGAKARVETNAAAKESIKQGFDPAIIASVKGGSGVDKSNMEKMVNILEKGKKNADFAFDNRPSDVLGETVMKRFNVINSKNKQAANMLDRVAESLKGKTVDIESPVNVFLDDLIKQGVEFDGLTPLFHNASFQGIEKAEKIITKLVDRMAKTSVPDAHDVHRLKGFIDEQVTYGKSPDGFSGKMSGLVKKLRHNLDSELDAKFPRYNKVNTTYSETRNALDAFQDVAGRKMDLTGDNVNKAVGTLMRKILSNAQGRIPLMDATKIIEDTAKRYGGKFTDSIKKQSMFADELDKVFKPVARTSFQGQIGQAIDRSVQSVASGGKSDILRALKAGAKKAQGINETNGLKAIRKLLRQ